jgi:hypothetical protein
VECSYTRFFGAVIGQNAKASHRLMRWDVFPDFFDCWLVHKSHILKQIYGKFLDRQIATVIHELLHERS